MQLAPLLLVQVEQQHLRRLHADQFDVRFVINRRRVTAGQCLAVQFHFALGDVDPRMTSRVQLVRDPVLRRELGQPEFGVLMDGDGTITSGFARHQVQNAGRRILERLLRITRCHALGIRLDPDLEQMHGFILRGIEFAMLDALAGGHVLHVAGLDDAAVAHGILVFQLAAQDVGDDLHVAMRMRAETHARHHEIVVDDAQAAITHPVRIVVIRKAEGVITVQPPMTRVAPFVGFKYFHMPKH
jgi:hypothetical protein